MPRRKWLINARKARKYTQGDVAHKVEISQSAYADYELGKKNPLGGTAYLISRLLDFRMERFYEDDERLQSILIKIGLPVWR